MKFEFKKEIIPEHIFEELDYKGHLALFETDLDLLSCHTLHPLQKSAAHQHFSRLHKLKEQIRTHRIQFKLLIERAKQLPSIAHLLPFFRDSQLEVYHLFDLGRFVQESLVLDSQEEQIPLKSKTTVCKTIQQTLLVYLTEDFGSIKLNASESELHQAILEINQELGNKSKKLEDKVYKETGLKMVYPFPKEISKPYEKIEELQSCNILNVKEQGDIYLLEIRVQDDIAALWKKKEELTQKLKASHLDKLKKVNGSLTALYESFYDYYEQRKRRIIDYILLQIAEQHGWCLPRLSASPHINLRKGVLPALQQKEPGRYKALDLSLQKGVNVLFGANMTGKTTVLKTVFFHLTLVTFGLPVPAEFLELGFPEEVKLHLRSSGQLKSGLSGFGDELRFFCEPTDNSSVYLIDELFHSTDPVNGVKLSKAFLKGLSDSNSIIFCTSHYSEVLELSNVTFFKMKDVSEESDEADLQSLLENIPYELEPINPGNLQGRITHSDHPLKIALRFPLPAKILNTIRKTLEK